MRNKIYLIKEGTILEELGGTDGLYQLTFDIIRSFRSVCQNPVVELITLEKFPPLYLRVLSYAFSFSHEGIDKKYLYGVHKKMSINYIDFF